MIASNSPGAAGFKIYWLDLSGALLQSLVMDADEREIFDYLKASGEEWVNAKEICRRAGGKRKFSEDPSWARPILQRMKERRILEADMASRFRIRPVEKKEHKGKWVSPDIQKILSEGGMEGDPQTGGLGTDEHYEQL
jgi:hypothetical protein